MLKKFKHWKRFIALLVVLALVIQCNFNAIALDSDGDKQQSAVAVVKETENEETTTEEEKEEPKQEVFEEKEGPKQEVMEEKEELKQEAVEEKEEPKQEAVEEKKEEEKQEAAKETEEPKEETNINSSLPDSFSISGDMKAGTLEEDETIERDISSDITEASMMIQIDSNWYDLSEIQNKKMTVPKGASVEVKIGYGKLENLKVNEILVYQLPEAITIIDECNGNVMDSDEKKAGTYHISTGGKISIAIDSEYMEEHQYTLLGGTVTVSGSFRDNWGEAGEGNIIKIGEIELVIPIEEKPQAEVRNITVKKTITSFDHNTNYIYYQIEIKTDENNTKEITNIKIQDTFTVNGEYIDGKYAEMQYSKDGISFNNETATWTIGTMGANKTVTIRYRVHVKGSFFNQENTILRQGISNKVVLSADEIESKESTAEQPFNNTLQIRKQASTPVINYTSGETTVQYTVTVTAPESNTSAMKNVRVEDAFGTNKNYVKAYVNNSIFVEDAVNESVSTSDENKNLIWTIGTMEKGDTKTLEYSVKLQGSVWAASNNSSSIDQTIWNKATVYSGNDQYADSDASVRLRKTWIWKNGEATKILDSEGKEIDVVKFVIHANESTNNGPVLDVVNYFEDNLQGDAEFFGQMTVNVYQSGPNPLGRLVKSASVNMNDIIKPGDTKNQSWRWIPSGDLKGAYYYEIIYYARPTKSGVSYISNGADIGIGIGNEEYSSNASWAGTGYQSYDLQKRYTGGVVTGEAQWETTIPFNIQANTVYYDKSENEKAETHYFTKEQLDAIKIFFDGEEVGKEHYTVTGPNDNGKSFSIKFTDSIEGVSINKPVKIVYRSMVKHSLLKEGQTETYKNYCSLQMPIGRKVGARAECSYTQRADFNKSAGEYNKENQTITWYLDVNRNSTLSGNAMIVDHLPKGLTFESAEIVTRGSEAQNTAISYDNDTDIVRREDGGYDVTLEVTNLVKNANNDGTEEGWIRIQVVTKRATEDLVNTEQIYENKATLTYDGKDKSAVSSIKVSYESIKKDSLYNSSSWPYVEYTLTLNPDRKDLLKEADTIDIIDQMNEYMILVPDSIRVKKSEDGSSISEWQLKNEAEAHKFTLTIPDEEALTISYKVYVNQPTGKKITLVNEAYYEGTVPGKPSENEKQIIVHDSSATVSGPATLKLSKLSKNENKALSGAEFTLYETEVQNGEIHQKEEGKTAVTDETGIAKITGLELDKVYCYYESKAPDGYKLDDTKHYITYKKIDESLEKLYNTNGSFSYGQKGTTISVEDEKTMVSIKKVDRDGNPVTGAALAIKDAETGEIVKRWTTDGNVKEITGELIAGRTYYLIEEKAPEGYLIAADVEFTVPLKVDEDPLEVTMTDPKDEGTKKLGHISVTKKIVSREIAGDFDLFANDATYYVGLFTDPDGNHPYGQNAIREAHIVNGSASEPVVYEKLPTGTYYVLETTKNGTPIPMNSEVTDDKSSFVCEVTDGGTNAVEINTEAEKMEGKVNLTNAYLELPDGFAYRAFIDVTKKVLENGVEKATDETFYAGIFTGETENAPMTLVELKNNGKVTVEVPLGGPDGDQPITYYVFETDAQGNKLDKDTFIYIVSGEGQVSVSREKIQSDITITNNLISEVSLEILKVDEDGYGLEGAKFQITSADGKAVLKKWKSDEESKEITLAPGTYKLIETAAPKGYIQGSDVTITISRDGTISIDGDDASLDDSVIEYVNQIDDSTTSKQDKKNGGTSKTGDPTHIMFYAILMAAALLGCMGVTRRKKGRHDR